MTQSCRICDGPARSSYILHSHRHALDVPLWHCPRCRAYFSSGGPTAYDDSDLSSYYAAYADSIRGRYERMFEFIETRLHPATFMDVGAGMGYSLEVAQRRGWIAAGIEPNAALVRSASSRGLHLHHGYLGAETRGSHALVLIDNVLEHVPDPKGFLVNAARLLAPGGLLVVAIPPLDWLRRALGSIAYVRDHVERPQVNVFAEVDEHVNLLGRKAMRRLVASVGLGLEATRYHHSPLVRNPLARVMGIDDGYYFMRRIDAISAGN